MLGIIGGTSLLFSTLPELEKQRVATPFGSAEMLSGDIGDADAAPGRPPPAPDQFPGKPRGTRDRRASPRSSPSDPRVPSSRRSCRVAPDPHGLHQPGRYPLHPRPCDRACPARNSRRSSAKNLHARSLRPGYGGVYVQTRGPRIETVAEVKSLAWIADIVGMTVASEATLACELGIQFAALCTIENYANGLGDEVLTYEHIVSVSREHRHRRKRS